MNDFMNDINNPEPDRNTVIPVKKPDYSDGSPAKEAVFSSADVYAAGKLTPIKERSIVEDILKGVLGACIGALPGLLLWILIGKIGFIVSICGLILAVGTVGGYYFMTNDKDLSPTVGAVVCILVIVIGIFFAEKIVWCWEMTDQFQKFKQEYYSMMAEMGLEEEAKGTIGQKVLKEEFGFTEGTFSDFFNNFHHTLDVLELENKYRSELIRCYIFAAIGATSFIAKFLQPTKI